MLVDMETDNFHVFYGLFQIPMDDNDHGDHLLRRIFLIIPLLIKRLFYRNDKSLFRIGAMHTDWYKNNNEKNQFFA